MNIAIVGYGAIAHAHARAITLLRQSSGWHDLRLTAVAGRLPEPAAAFAREFGCETATTDLEIVLANPAVDAVILCSPTDLHAPQAELALRAGKHVLCEIPVATSLADTDRLIAIADNARRRLMVCHTMRFQPALTEVRQRIDSGDLYPLSVVGRYLFLARQNVGRTGRARSWTDNLLWHHGCHAVDTVLWLLDGSAAAVDTRATRPGTLGIPMDIVIGISTSGDKVASVALSYNCHVPVFDFVVVGQETSLIVDRKQFRTQASVTADGTSHPLARQDAEFLSALRDGRESDVSARAIRPTMAALQAAQDVLTGYLDASGSGAQ